MTQCDHIIDVLEAARAYRGEPEMFGFRGDGWVALERMTSLPGGGIITQPTARLSELAAKGYVIERRQRWRYDRQGKHIYTMSDWKATP